MPSTTIFANLPDGFNLMALFDQAFAQNQAAYPPNTLTGSGPFPIGGTEYGDILVNCVSAVTVNLPAAASRGNQPLRIIDISGNASTNNITIVPNGSEHISGLTSIVIATNWGAYKLAPLPSGGYYLQP